MLARVLFGDEMYRRGVGAPDERRMDAAVPARARDRELAVAPVDERQALRVDEAALEVLRDERDPPAVGRVARRLVVER